VSPLEAALRRIAGDLGKAGLDWALIGGLAVSARAEPRTTRDVDVAVAVADDAQAETLVLRLQAAGFRALTALEQQAAHRLATVRLAAPGEDARGVVVDLLFASSGIERELVARAELIEILPGLVVPVARIGHLMALKVLARDDRRRPQDFDDLRALLRESVEADVQEARAALSLIEARGYARERRLVDSFEEFLREEMPPAPRV
jgi:predicted nucleotidyltransferase